MSGVDKAEWLKHEMRKIVRERIGMKEEFCAIFADAILDGMRERLGGQEIYIAVPDKASRNQLIRAKFNGRNLAEVMREFDVCERTVRNALK